MAPGLKPDLVISDLVMPAAGGDRAYIRLRQNTFTQATPVIFLTGMPVEEAKQVAPKGQNVVLLNKMDAIFQKLDEAVLALIGKP
ncbi:MAG: hypothetical protein WC943_15285 [Elusimicrobiota bacterium]|jgi:CheY-like chemotaxis protein